MTLETLEAFGIWVERDGEGFRIPGGQAYRPSVVTVESDWSQAAFWYAAQNLGSRIEIQNASGIRNRRVDPDSPQSKCGKALLFVFNSDRQRRVASIS